MKLDCVLVLQLIVTIDNNFKAQNRFLLQQMGCWLTTSESVILSLVGDSRVPQFKSLQKLIHDKSLDAGKESENRRRSCSLIFLYLVLKNLMGFLTPFF